MASIGAAPGIAPYPRQRHVLPKPLLTNRATSYLPCARRLAFSLLFILTNLSGSLMVVSCFCASCPFTSLPSRLLLELPLTTRVTVISVLLMTTVLRLLRDRGKLLLLSQLRSKRFSTLTLSLTSCSSCAYQWC